MVDGEILVEGGMLTRMDRGQIVSQARQEAGALARRAGL
jgi:hypothetical protein